jgi:hypothetical protein
MVKSFDFSWPAGYPKNLNNDIFLPSYTTTVEVKLPESSILEFQEFMKHVHTAACTGFMLKGATIVGAPNGVGGMSKIADARVLRDVNGLEAIGSDALLHNGRIIEDYGRGIGTEHGPIPLCTKDDSMDKPEYPMICQESNSYGGPCGKWLVGFPCPIHGMVHRGVPTGEEICPGKRLGPDKIVCTGQLHTEYRSDSPSRLFSMRWSHLLARVTCRECRGD